jgi:hypothetical protein
VVNQSSLEEVIYDRGMRLRLDAHVSSSSSTNEHTITTPDDKTSPPALACTAG